MKRKLLSVIFGLSLVLVGIFAFSSCGDKDDEKETENQPSQTPCAHVEEIIPKIAPTCVNAGKTEGKKCSICGEITVAQADIPMLTEHNYNEDGKCVFCNAEVPYTQGLAFVLINEDTEYAVCGIGDVTDTEIYIPKEYNGKPVTEIAAQAFKGCENLKKIIILNSIKTIQKQAFQYCVGLTNIIIPNSVTTIEQYAFSTCISLTSIIIPDSVTTIAKGAFNQCMGLRSVTIGKNVSTIEEKALNAPILEVYNKSALNITKESECFDNFRYNVLNIYTPENGESKLDFRDDGYVFYADGDTVYLAAYQGDAKDITLPENYNGKKYEISLWAFARSSAFLNSIVISGGVTTIGVSSFEECESMTSVIISNGVVCISDAAFESCKSLANIELPASITVIGDSAFSRCKNLKNITFKGTMEQWKAITKAYNWNYDTGNYTIHCTDGDIAKS